MSPVARRTATGRPVAGARRLRGRRFGLRRCGAWLPDTLVLTTRFYRELSLYDTWFPELLGRPRGRTRTLSSSIVGCHPRLNSWRANSDVDEIDYCQCG